MLGLGGAVCQSVMVQFPTSELVLFCSSLTSNRSVVCGIIFIPLALDMRVTLVIEATTSNRCFAC